MNEALLEAPIADVTVLEDRARVRRRGQVALEPGPSRLRIEGVAPVLSDRTASARVVSPEGARVIDVRARRRAVFDPVSENDLPAAVEGASDRPALVLELSRIDGELERVRARRELAESRSNGLDKLAELAVSELSEDVSWGREAGNEWPQRLAEIRARERELAKHAVTVDREIDELERRRDRIRERIAQITNAAARQAAALEIDVDAPEGGEVVLEIEYLVPGACWRPRHTARLSNGERTSIEIETDACVWQNTGEDWDQVELLFSTERPSLGAEPPQLTTDLLRVKKRSEAVEVEVRDQAVETTGLGRELEAVSFELPGVDDGGEVLELRAEGRVRVPSDGRPHRIRLGSTSAEAEVELISMPELSPTVLQRSVQTNRSERPLLAGPVDLIRDSGLVGRTSVLFVAPGEKFELGWGPEPELRIKRTEEVSDDESRRLSSWVARAHRVLVRLSNIGGESRQLSVVERVPISEIDKVKVELDPRGTTGEKEPDDDGFVRWTVEMAPLSQKSLELRYTLKKHEDVVGL